MEKIETIISIFAGIIGTLFLTVPFLIKKRNWIYAEKKVFSHLGRSTFHRNNRWCTIEYISKEENLDPPRVKAVLMKLRSKNLVVSSRSKEKNQLFWSLSDQGVEKYMTSQ